MLKILDCNGKLRFVLKDEDEQPVEVTSEGVRVEDQDNKSDQEEDDEPASE